MSDREIVGFNPWFSDIQAERLEAFSYLLGRPRTKLASDLVVQTLVEPPDSPIIQQKETEMVCQSRVFFYLDNETAVTLRKLAEENGVKPNTAARRLINHTLNSAVQELPQIDIVADLHRGVQQRLGDLSLRV
jgi:hypothetical protein